MVGEVEGRTAAGISVLTLTSAVGEFKMPRTALEVLFMEAGYSARRADQMAMWIDQAGVRGMSADDLFSAFMIWRRKTQSSEAVIKRLRYGDSLASQLALEAIRAEVIKAAEEARKYQLLMPFAAQPESLALPQASPTPGT